MGDRRAIPKKIRELAKVLFMNSHTREVHASILECLRNQYLPMVFQPIVNHDTSDVFAHEGLSRPSYRETAIPPDVWFTVAHEYHHSLDADLLAIRQAISQSSIGLRKETPQLLFINMMPSSLLSRSFRIELEAIFRSGLCEPRQMVFEITEHISYDSNNLRDVIQLLRTLGVRFALDDVGSGSSNLKSIVELEPEFIKIDRALISGISSSDSKRKMVSQLLDYMGVADRVIAEGIENRADLDAVKEIGIALSQGYIWSKPHPFEQLPTMQQLFGTLPLSSSTDVVRRSNGTVKVCDGHLVVTDPSGLGHFATVEIPSDHRIRINVNGKFVKGRIVLQQSDNVIIESRDIEPTSRLITRESSDKMEVIVVRQITSGERYHLVDHDESNHISLEIKAEAVYPAPLASETIVGLLESAGYEGTINQHAVEQLCTSHETLEMTVLTGTRPIPGTPDTYEGIEFQRVYDPLHRRMQTSTVTAGMTVAKLNRGVPGIPGRNVLGQPVEPPQSVGLPELGPGVSQIGEVLVAIRNGRLLFSRDRIDVIPELVIRGDFTSKHGIVDFDGDVIVYGSILDGAYLQCSGTVTVHSSVMCATVMAERGVFVSGTIVGSQVVAGQSKFLFQKLKPLLARSIAEYKQFIEEYEAVLQHARYNAKSEQHILMVPNLLMEERHPALLNYFEQLVHSCEDVSSKDALFSQLIRELRSKWLVIKRTKVSEHEVHSLYDLLVRCLERIESTTSTSNAGIRVNSVTSSALRATGSIVVKGSGSFTSNLESEYAILVKGNARGGFLIAKKVVRANQVGTPSGSETAIRVVDENGFIAVNVRYPNTLLQVGHQRSRNLDTEKRVVYRGNESSVLERE